MSDDPREVITISHPDIEVASTVTRRQFERLYEARGWVEDPEESKPVATSVRTQPPRFDRKSSRLSRRAATWPPPVRGAEAALTGGAPPATPDDDATPPADPDTDAKSTKAGKAKTEGSK